MRVIAILKSLCAIALHSVCSTLCTLLLALWCIKSLKWSLRITFG